MIKKCPICGAEFESPQPTGTVCGRCGLMMAAKAAIRRGMQFGVRVKGNEKKV